MSQPAISKHLKVLEAASLVSRRRHARQHLCRLEAHGLRPVHEWTGGFDRFWSESFDRLDEYLQDLKQATQKE